MSFLGVGTSWLPMIFAIFLCEMKNLRFRRFVQTFTTIPNFISWVLVYAVALAIFSTDGFINTFLKEIGVVAQNAQGKAWLMSSKHTWLKMWAWGTWKGVGWSAIIYIAGISGIPNNMDTIRVLDLWVYDLGINGGSIPLSTVIGMAKSIVSVALLFGANSVSKALRGESIV